MDRSTTEVFKHRILFKERRKGQSSFGARTSAWYSRKEMQNERLTHETSLRTGFGMLRVDPESIPHREALRDALVSGVTLFDLGDFANESPRFAAKAKLLEALITEYAPGSVRVIVRGTLGHAERLTLPAASARIEWIYLVADPEFALPEVEFDHARLYSLLTAELDLLEGFCQRGKLAAYGIGSAALTYPKESPEAIALEPLLTGRERLDWEPGLALRPESRRHFRWLEFPFNLYESQAATEETQVAGIRTLTLLEAAVEWEFTTVARRPLDGVTEHGLRRFIAYPDHHRLDLHEAVRLTLETALVAEAEFLAKRNHARTVAGDSAEMLDPLWAHRLRDQLKYVSDPEQWKEILRRRIGPDLAKILKANGKIESTPEAGSTRYFDAMNALLLSVRLWCEKAAAERNERLRARMIEASPTLARKRLAEDRDLALLAMRIYRSVPGLDFVLAGMRSSKYVQAFVAAEAATAEDKIPADEIQAIFQSVHAQLSEGSA